MNKNTTDIVPRRSVALKLNKSAQRQVMIRAEAESGGYIPHISLDDVIRIAEAASVGRHGERDKLLVQTLFDGCLRVSEALRLTPGHIKQDADGWLASVFGKGGRTGIVAISPSLAAQLQAYAYRQQLRPDDRFFPFSRTRAFQIVQEAMQKAGVRKPDHVGTVHVLRHSGALERLRRTGNPKAVQEQLRHQTMRQTLRYFKTLQSDEAMKIQEKVDLGW